MVHGADQDLPNGNASGHQQTTVAAAEGTTGWSRALREAVLEIDREASRSGWDRPARLFALVPTHDLLAANPVLADDLGTSTAQLTAVEQELDEHVETLESLLERITWPNQVLGALVVMERFVLPAEAEAGVPDDPAASVEYASRHPRRQEVRMAAGVVRDGTAYCTLRVRAHDDDGAVLEGTDLVPGLVAMLRETFEPDDEESVDVDEADASDGGPRSDGTSSAGRGRMDEQ